MKNLYIIQEAFKSEYAQILPHQYPQSTPTRIPPVNDFLFADTILGFRHQLMRSSFEG